MSERIGLTPLTQYTSLTFIWVLCLGCERAHLSHLHLCLVFGCERANRVNASIVEPLSHTFSWLVFCFLSFYVLIFMFIDHPFALCGYCYFCVSAILPHALPGLHIPMDGHWQHDMRYPESFLTLPCTHVWSRSPDVRACYFISAALPYIQTQECLVSN